MKDLFSRQSDQYAKYRPTYPAELYEFILSHVPGREAAWDCATGNGQVAGELARHFQKVAATDISEKQLAEALPNENIDYQVASAETSLQADYSFDLITVGQALHWFDFEAFYAEVRRVTKPGGVLAVWGYELLNIDPEVDALILNFYQNVVGIYWAYERRYVQERYATVPFPFREIPAPEFPMVKYWTLGDLAGYFDTWSSVDKFRQQHGYSPVGELAESLRPFWPAGERKAVTFPIFMRIGIVD
ncbi:MAG: class I SAM-dependent methyltransferase [Sphingobacteriaceae bacterium]|nr:class I SAM-dependent methyltransferase [Cytophagaceae bacterium]